MNLIQNQPLQTPTNSGVRGSLRWTHKSFERAVEHLLLGVVETQDLVGTLGTNAYGPLLHSCDPDPTNPDISFFWHRCGQRCPCSLCPAVDRPIRPAQTQPQRHVYLVPGVAQLTATNCMVHGRLYLLTVMEGRCQQSRAPSGGSRGQSFLPLPAPGAPGVPVLVAMSPHLCLHPHLPMSMYQISPSLLCKDLCHWIQGPPNQGSSHFEILSLFHLQRTLFQRRPHSEVPGGNVFWGPQSN